MGSLLKGCPMRLLELVVPAYEVGEKKVGAKVYPAHTIPSKRLALAPEHVIAVEEVEDGKIEVRVFGFNVPYEVEGTYEEVTALWRAARTEAQP